MVNAPSATENGRVAIAVSSVNAPEAPHDRPHHELLALLRDAIDGQGFVLCAQPVVDLATGDAVKHKLTCFCGPPGVVSSRRASFFPSRIDSA